MTDEAAPQGGVDDFRARVERRPSAVPSFFGSDSPLVESLWRQAEVCYLDNPLPPPLKERVFVYLARFCNSPYCLARHLAFLMQRPAGDPAEPSLTSEEIVDLLRHPLPGGGELDAMLARLEGSEGLPEPGSELERDLVDCAAHLFLRTRVAERCRGVLRRALPPDDFDALIALLGFVQLARTWTESHPEIEPESDVEELLDREVALSKWIDERWPPAGQPHDVDGHASEAEARFRLAVAAAHAMVYESDLENDRIVAMDGLDGLLGEETSGARPRAWWLDRIHPDDRRAVVAAMGEREAHDGFRIAYRIRHHDGRWIHVVEHARILRGSDRRPLRHIGVVLDVSQRRAVERELEERTAELEAIVDNMADGVVIYDGEGAIRRINHAALETVGLTSPEEARTALEELDERYLLYDGLGRLLGADEWPLAKARRFEPFRGDEVTVVDRKTSHRFSGLFSGVALRDAGGAPHLYVLTFRDVTERKRAEDELRASEQRLRDLAERKDEFLAMLGHELRNPLSSIRSAADMLQLLPLEDPRVDRLRRVLDRQSAHMAKLVDGLLDAARVVRGKVRLDKQLIHLRDVVEEVMADRREDARQLGIDLVVDRDGDGIQLVADRMRLTQILDNLLANALKYTRSGGHVTVTALREGDEAVVRICDDGVGMSPELLSHLFEPFQQGPQAYHRPEGGLGLGLAVAHGLVERHGGRIIATSDGEDRGSTFEVRLAAAPAKVVEAARRRRGSDALSVLVVEDEPDYADTLRMLLEALGHEVEVARDGKEALSAAAAHPPDVVLCDLGLPHGMTGYDVAELLCQQHDTRDAYLVALTGYNRTEDRQRAERAGFDDFLAKPAGAEAIQAALMRAHRRS